MTWVDKILLGYCVGMTFVFLIFILSLQKNSIYALKTFRHIYQLMDFLAMGLPEPAMKIYSGMKSLGPEVSSDQQKVMLDKLFTQHYNDALSRLDARIKDTEDPIEKQHLIDQKDKWVEVMTLFSLVDNSSSREYTQEVLANIQRITREIQSL